MGWSMNISQVTAKDDEALEYLNVLVRVKAIMVGLARQSFPLGCLCMLRRDLEEVVDGVVSLE